MVATLSVQFNSIVNSIETEPFESRKSNQVLSNLYLDFTTPTSIHDMLPSMNLTESSTVIARHGE